MAHSKRALVGFVLKVMNPLHHKVRFAMGGGHFDSAPCSCGETDGLMQCVVEDWYGCWHGEKWRTRSMRRLGSKLLMAIVVRGGVDVRARVKGRMEVKSPSHVRRIFLNSPCVKPCSMARRSSASAVVRALR